MNRKRGFTLIELLAVIVILAIIALIATPIIVGVINKSKKNAFLDASYGVLEAGKLYYAKNLNNDAFTGETFTFPDDAGSLKLSGEKPGGGTLFIGSKGETTLSIFDKGKNWCANKEEKDEKVTIKKYTDTCGEADTENNTEQLNVLMQKQINKNTETVCTEAGGVLSGNCYFKGTEEEINKNYVWYSGLLWRVLSVSNNGNVKMISELPLTAIHAFDEKYLWSGNATYYKDSSLNRWLSTNFYENLSTEAKASIQKENFCIGVVGNNCALKSEANPAGVLTEEEYNKSGGQNSYLNNQRVFTLANYKTATTLAYVNNKNQLLDTPYYNLQGIRPVITISSFVPNRGNGTKEKPYQLYTKKTTITDIDVGSYISVPKTEDGNYLVRVVDKKVGIKVVLNDTYGSSIMNSNNAPWYDKATVMQTYLNNFYKQLHADYVDGANHGYGNFRYLPGDGNTVWWNKTQLWQGKIALLSVADWFSGNDILLRSNELVWTMTTSRNTGGSGQFIAIYGHSSGVATTILANGSAKVRPAWYLKNDLAVISGEGTLKSPYILKG